MSAHSKQGVVGTGGMQGAGSFAIWSCSLAGFRESLEEVTLGLRRLVLFKLVVPRLFRGSPGLEGAPCSRGGGEGHQQ